MTPTHMLVKRSTISQQSQYNSGSLCTVMVHTVHKKYYSTDQSTINHSSRKRKLQAKEVPKRTPPINSQTLKFGTFNINGLNLEAGWAVEKLITNRGFDVSIIL